MCLVGGVVLGFFNNVVTTYLPLRTFLLEKIHVQLSSCRDELTFLTTVMVVAKNVSVKSVTFEVLF